MCLVIDIQENSHNIAAFGISYCTDTACILYFSNITWMLEMIHYFHYTSFFPPGKCFNQIFFFLTIQQALFREVFL